MSIKKQTKNIIMPIIAIIFALIYLFPVIWAVICSFKPDGEIFEIPPTFFPRDFTLYAYTSQLVSIGRPFINSCIIAISSMILSLCLSLPAGYGLGRFKVKGLSIFILIFLTTQMLPSSLILTPLYLIYSKINFLNTYFAPIFATATISIPFVVLLIRPIFGDTPAELEESAKIDGCNSFSAFIRIALPVAKSGIVTAACFGFVMAWNDLAYSMTFNVKPEMRPLTAGIYNFMNQYGTQWNRILAYGIILILPPVVLFLTMQKQIIKGLVSGAVKG